MEHSLEITQISGAQKGLVLEKCRRGLESTQISGAQPRDSTERPSVGNYRTGLEINQKSGAQKGLVFGICRRGLEITQISGAQPRDNSNKWSTERPSVGNMQERPRDN